jgi:hypothetical protein
MDLVRQELTKKFAKIVPKQRDYGFYLAVHEYVDFIYNNDTTFNILLHERHVYSDLHQFIVDAWQRTQDQCYPLSDELYEEIENLYGSQVRMMESANLYCRYLSPKAIHYIIEEMNGAENFKKPLEAPARERETLEVQEIRFGKISRKNGLANGGGKRIYDSLSVVHFGILDRLFIAPSEQEVTSEPSEEAAIKIEPLRFDKEKSILYLRGEKILIAIQDKQTIAHKILEHIFAKPDLRDQFFYSEIAMDAFWDETYKGNKNGWRRYYSACEQINEKIRTHTISKIDDFLFYSTGRTGKVRINPKYLDDPRPDVIEKPTANVQ